MTYFMTTKVKLTFDYDLDKNVKNLTSQMSRQHFNLKTRYQTRVNKCTLSEYAV